jgi:hypothetical protein
MKNKYKLPFSFLFLLSVFFTHAQTAEEIINKHLDAVGGKKKITSIESVKKVFQTDNEITGSGSIVMVEGVGARSESKGLFGTSIQIVNKKKGWSVVQTPLDDKAEVKELSETDRSLAFPGINLDLDEMFHWDNLMSYVRYSSLKYYTMTLLGKENVAGKECFKLKIKYDLKTETWWVDGSTWYLVQRELGSGADATTIRYSDLKKNSDGLTLAYKEEIIGKEGKVLVTSTISEFETNFKVDKSIFTYKPQ